jgi:hypothetical protein
MSLPEKYEETMKKVVADTKANKENFMIVELSYDKKLILPYADGIQLMAAFQKAELLTEDYGKPPRISGLHNNEVKVSLLSQKFYQLYKISELLKLDKEAHLLMVSSATS